MISIEVCERLMDRRHVMAADERHDSHDMRYRMVEAPVFHSQFGSEGGTWEVGNTVAEAVGRLVMNNPERCTGGVKVKVLEGKHAR
jgi:hypothetical protein